MHPLLSLLQESESQVAPDFVAHLKDLSQQLLAENTQLQEENARLTRIIQDIRQRDAGKKCLCRGFG